MKKLLILFILFLGTISLNAQILTTEQLNSLGNSMNSNRQLWCYFQFCKILENISKKWINKKKFELFYNKLMQTFQSLSFKILKELIKLIF